MESIKEFTASEKTINRQLFMGVFMVVAGIVLFFLTGYSTLLGLGILYIIMGVISRDRKIIKLYPDHMEIKLAPLASKKLLKYDQITNFSVSKKNLELHHNSQKKVRIPIALLENEKIHELDSVLKEKTDLDETNSWVLT